MRFRVTLIISSRHVYIVLSSFLLLLLKKKTERNKKVEGIKEFKKQLIERRTERCRRMCQQCNTVFCSQKIFYIFFSKN